MTQTSTDDPIELRVSTVGQHLPGHRGADREPRDERARCRPGRRARWCCRGYNVMKGYYNMPEATAQAIDADGWLHSGDLGTMDANGYFKITGRIKDMIIRGGENVYPREIEEFLLTMEGVKDIQVAGVAEPEVRRGGRRLHHLQGRGMPVRRKTCGTSAAARSRDSRSRSTSSSWTPTP